MAKLQIQLQDANNNIVEEKELNVNENETLIMKYPDGMSNEQALICFKYLEEALKGDCRIIGLPETISFEILKVTEK